MFSIYIDDSGTDPNQAVAIASALIIPATQIVRFQTEWDNFREKYGFTEFHTSEFMARNSRSEFSNWDDTKQARVFKRVCQISRKYGARAISIAVNKKDYDEVMPNELRGWLGRTHYGWAVRHLLANIDKRFPLTPDKPREFIFDYLERREPARQEIEEIMDWMQYLAEHKGSVGDYSDPHFRRRENIPGLQCVDAVAWISYQHGLRIFKKTPLKKLAAEAWKDLDGHNGFNGWLMAVTLRRESLQRSVQQAMAQKEDVLKLLKEWNQKREKT